MTNETVKHVEFHMQHPAVTRQNCNTNSQLKFIFSQQITIIHMYAYRECAPLNS